MTKINHLIWELIEYGKRTGLISEDDETYSINRLLEFFSLNEYTSPDQSDTDKTEIRELSFILEDMLEYAASAGMMENDTITYRDLMDTAIMGLITPPPSQVRSKFKDMLSESPKKATDFYYEFSKATNYIRTDRIKKDEKWVSSTAFGDLDITINLSKPEKDPRDIAAAGKAKKSGYPACLLCMENEGYAGHFSHPARQNHRIIPISLDEEEYFLQYSPYVYYNEHCIIFNKKHIPMKINKSAMKKLLSFVEMFPHYTAGSNADLPIVGGSILSHDHFQGGGYEFPMVRAPFLKEFTIPGYDDVHSGIIKWPLSTIRLQGKNIDRITDLADHILSAWRSYTDEAAFIYAETDGTPHNTITPIARMRDSVFELDLVLRNNITTEEHPLGVYHPHARYHHIKKENIGLIEVMGLAVLPARLKKEMSSLEEIIFNSGNLNDDPILASHIDWAKEFLPKYGYSVNESGDIRYSDKSGISDNAEQGINTVPDKSKINRMIRDEIGLVFCGVLEDAGVYKQNPDGIDNFMKFINTL